MRTSQVWEVDDQGTQLFLGNLYKDEETNNVTFVPIIRLPEYIPESLVSTTRH